MSQISRLRDAEITNGNLINADDIDTELNQLVSESNGQDTRLTAIENASISIGGVKTFTSSIKTDQIDERTSTAGVTIDSVLLKDGALKLLPDASYVASTNGALGYNSTSHSYQVMVNGIARSLMHEGNGLPKGYMAGPAPVFATVNTITLKSGFRCRNSSNTSDMEITTDLTVSLAISGANGLDSGTEAANTWYYVYLIKKSSDGTVAGLLSTVNEAVSGAVTLPTGYDLKRQLPVVIRNDASSNILKFNIANGWPSRPLIRYVAIFTRATAGTPTFTVSPTHNILSNGSATTWTAISGASLIPPASRYALFNLVNHSNATSGFDLREAGESAESLQFMVFGGGQNALIPMRVSAAQAIEYQKTFNTSGLDVDVIGFYVTEIV